ncbi:uncharacterized protein BDV14DRAFT_167766 [Aspergillus stella-maris]|uniref:uncharacterized protein n=1 Tax=Aspergillus stella-maris TaxID=1810926 RepID=UPI003CCCE17B
MEVCRLLFTAITYLDRDRKLPRSLSFLLYFVSSLLRCSVALSSLRVSAGRMLSCKRWYLGSSNSQTRFSSSSWIDILVHIASTIRDFSWKSVSAIWMALYVSMRLRPYL